MVYKRFILLVLLSACPALASTLNAIGVDTSLGWQNSLWINSNGNNERLYWAGGVDIAVDGYQRVAFCVDLLTNINVPGTYRTTLDFSDTPYSRAGVFSDVPSLERVGWLLQNEFPTSQLAGAAFQLAIWDIITDHGNGFDTGTVAKSSSTVASAHTDPFVLAAAIQYESDSVNKRSSFGIVYHNTSGSVPVQTLMGGSATDDGPSPAPEPAAIALISSGLALIGLSRLRRGAPR